MLCASKSKTEINVSDKLIAEKKVKNIKGTLESATKIMNSVQEN